MKKRQEGASFLTTMMRVVPTLAILFGLPYRGDIGHASWKAQSLVQAQSASTQRKQSSSRQQRPSLHNQNHESTIRNILQPRFVSQSNPLQSGNHTSNVAIIVSSSRYWFNYRHVTNALSIYNLLKRGGITDDNIILMLADDIPCNMRNPFRGKILPRGKMGGDLMEDAEVDYSGTDVTVDAFLRVLLGRHVPGEERGHGGTHRRHRRSWPIIDENTNILVYLTGHGGDNFFKFQDGEELMSHDISSAFSQMYEMKRYNEILFISDTCQAFTMADEIKVPNVFSVGSSLKGENSYASHSDADVGQSVIDRYSKIIKDFLDDAVTLTSHHSSKGSIELASEIAPTFDNATVAVLERLTLHEILVRIPMNHGELGPNSHVGHADHLSLRKINQVPMSDFFAVPSSVRDNQSQRNKRDVSPSLWMTEWSIVPESKILPRTKGETDNQCVPFVVTSEHPLVRDMKPRVVVNPTGISSNDFTLFIMSAGFLICVTLASRIW